MRRSPTSPIAGLVIALALLAPSSAGGDNPAQAEAVRVLRTLRDPAHAPVVELAIDFRRLAQTEANFLFDILETRRVPDFGEGSQALSRVQRELILAAFTLSGRASAIGSLGERIDAPEEYATRSALVQLLGAVGVPDDLDRVFDTALPREERTIDLRMSQTLRSAVEAILVREPEAFDVLERTWKSLPDVLTPPLLQAIGGTRDPRGLALITDVIYWNDDAMDVAMSQISKLGRSDDEHINTGLAEQLRTALDSDPSRCRTVCLALAMLGDLEAIPALIERLDSESKPVRESAIFGLRKMTGLPFPADARRWQHWYRSEKNWNEHGKAALLRRLRSDDAHTVEIALAEFATHPLGRADLIMALPSLLEHHSASIRLIGCQASLAAGANSLVDPLLMLFDDHDDAVANAAWRAAKQISGLDLEPDASLWRDALED